MRSTTSNRGMLNRSRDGLVLARGRRPTTRRREPVDHRTREQLGITQRVGESVDADRILEVAGVAHERPTRAVRTTDETVVSAPGAGVRLATAHRASGRRAAGAPSATIVADDVDAAVADAVRRRVDEHARHAVVRRDDAGARVRAEDPLEPVGVTIGPVRRTSSRRRGGRRGRTSRRLAARPSSGCRPHRSRADCPRSTRSPSAVAPGRRTLDRRG